MLGILFNERQKLKTWDELKQEYGFHENKRFLFMQLLHAIPKSWKNDLSDVKENIHNLVIQSHHIRKHHMHFLNRLSSNKICNFLIAQKEEQTSSRLYYQVYIIL